MAASLKHANKYEKIFFLFLLKPKGIETDGKPICQLNEGKKVLYSDISVCQQQVEPTLSEAIKNLPPDLREMIYKEFIAKKK